MMPFSIIVAMDKNRGIGQKGLLPWHLPADLKRFKEVTTHVRDPQKRNAVIMGRKTWESLPDKFRPLPNRLNIVISRNKAFNVLPGVVLVPSLEEALIVKDSIESVFVIGGEQIFKLAIKHPQCRQLFITHLVSSFACDAFMPDFPKDFQLQNKSDLKEENGIGFYFAQYVKN